MKGTYPENIDQIGDFYRGELQDGNIEPSASLWESIESNLTMLDVSSAASMSSSASTSLGKLVSLNMIWKGALIIGAAGAITVAVVVNCKKKDSKFPLNENNSIENKNATLVDTTAEARNNVSVTEREETKAIISEGDNIQTEELTNDSLPLDSRIEPIVADTVEPTIAPVQVVEEKEKEKEKKPNAKEKEAETKPGNFFERKLKQQKDTSSHLFKPNK
jgi:hypothetical protein